MPSVLAWTTGQMRKHSLRGTQEEEQLSWSTEGVQLSVGHSEFEKPVEHQVGPFRDNDIQVHHVRDQPLL